MKYRGKIKLKRKYSPHYTEKKPLFSEKEIIFRSSGKAMVFKISSKMQIEFPGGTIPAHAHNTFLQVIHDHGLIAGVLFVIFFCAKS